MIPIIDHILGKFSLDLGIDLGTANTLVYVRGKGIVIREPSIVAQNRKTKKVLAIGTEAKRMVGRTPKNIEAVRPLKDGVVCDFDTTLAMMSHFVRKVHEKPGRNISIPRPKIIIGVPTQISEVERRAVLDAAYASGAREVYLIEEPMAAAIGAGLPVSEPVGSMIVDIGGGTCEIAVISLGGIVVGKSLKAAGDAMEREIINYVRSRWGLLIGEKTAEELKMLLGSAIPISIEKEMVVRGRDLEKGLPKSIKVTSVQIREALAPAVSTIVSAIKEIVEDTPPELASDIAERGIILCGGGSLIWGLPKLISQETKMPVALADEPLNCVVSGCAELLENPALLKKVAITKI
ncbi:MAG: rod shape-determining protein [Candidatus Curtissbacteria bacterium]|nr:rod shape-determining protein [Candidatus Curtissbacteria bacterium]